ncbi:MAG: dipeptidase PepE [Gemmatimonadales bacterium]|nr:dipeptidase PepE [Gemmatimonadales bacterium]
MRLLLLSNSTNYGGTFLGHAHDTIHEFLGMDVGEILFVPYAAVRFSFDAMSAKAAEVFGALGYGMKSIHSVPNAPAAVEEAQAIAVAGGNTFQLLARLHQEQLLDPIRERVREGVPYIGWSAGSNVACPTIRTTNDMPITEPPSFDALGLVPFQINPHFTDGRIPNHGGETRSERLLEFVAANPGMPVIGLREGSILQVEDDRVVLLGDAPAVLFKSGQESQDIEPGQVEV